MAFKLRAKTVIVAGGATGIGYATAQKLLDNGAKNIIIASRNYEKMLKAVSSLKKNWRQKVYMVPLDICNVMAHDEFIRSVYDAVGEYPDGLVISSGVNFDGSNWKGFNVSEKDWDKVMNTNLKGVFFLMRTFANYLHANQIRGNICIVSSISAHRDLLSVYQISKNAISGIVHAYGKHLCERGIVLNCVESGTTDTDMMPHLAGYTDGVRLGKPWNDNSIRRVIRPEEIAEAICFLMSEGSELMSGTCLLAGGGCKTIAK